MLGNFKVSVMCNIKGMFFFCVKNILKPLMLFEKNFLKNNPIQINMIGIYHYLCLSVCIYSNAQLNLSFATNKSFS